MKGLKRQIATRTDFKNGKLLQVRWNRKIIEFIPISMEFSQTLSKNRQMEINRYFACHSCQMVG